jgi:hypothetical protein
MKTIVALILLAVSGIQFCGCGETTSVAEARSSKYEVTAYLGGESALDPFSLEIDVKNLRTGYTSELANVGRNHQLADIHLIDTCLLIACSFENRESASRFYYIAQLDLLGLQFPRLFIYRDAALTVDTVLSVDEAGPSLVRVFGLSENTAVKWMSVHKKKTYSVDNDIFLFGSRDVKVLGNTDDGIVFSVKWSNRLTRIFRFEYSSKKVSVLDSLWAKK